MITKHLLRFVFTGIILSSCNKQFPTIIDKVDKEHPSIIGKWYAKTNTNPPDHFLIDLRKNEDDFYGYLDLPNQNSFRLRLDTVDLSGNNNLYLKHKGFKFEFNGLVKNDQIEGDVKLDSLENRTIFFKTPQVPRSQTVKQSIPYLSQEVTFTNTKENIEFSGTLTIPNSTGKFPAVVLVSGSGPQDRDEEILGHRPFLILADHLTRNGIAVLRYDDRGTGKSKGKFRPATTLDYANDAEAAVNYLLQHPNIDTRSLGILGHSEGGNIAPAVAINNLDIDFIILLAAPGVSNFEMYLSTLDTILKDYPETYDRDFPFWKKVYQSMSEISSKKILRDTLTIQFKNWLETVSPEEQATFGDPQKYIQQEIDYHVSDWYHGFLQFDVTPYLEQLKIPVLALNGDKDFQVPADQNLSGLQKTLQQNPPAEVKTIELKNVNHFFQTCGDGKLQEVYFIQESFSPIALKEITSFIMLLNKK